MQLKTVAFEEGVCFELAVVADYTVAFLVVVSWAFETGFARSFIFHFLFLQMHSFLIFFTKILKCFTSSIYFSFEVVPASSQILCILFLFRRLSKTFHTFFTYIFSQSFFPFTFFFFILLISSYSLIFSKISSRGISNSVSGGDIPDAFSCCETFFVYLFSSRAKCLWTERWST